MSDWKLELRSGIEWMVRYEGNDVIEGYVPDRNDGSRVAEVVRDDAGLFVGMVGADVVAGPERWFDDALDKVYGELQFRTDLLDRFVWHDLTGKEGIYKLGERGGKTYIANAFWSDVEPGYANMGVFEVDLKSESLEILTSGFYNGYLTIEECVECESLEVAPLDAVKLEHICSCNWEFDNFTEFAEALDEHDLTVEEVLGGSSRDEIDALKQEVIDVANERTNDAFDDVMTYERAVRFFDEPGLGVPMFIEDKVRRIEKLEESVQDAIEKGIAAQIDEARTTSESMIDEDRSERSTQSVEDLER